MSLTYIRARNTSMDITYVRQQCSAKGRTKPSRECLTGARAPDGKMPVRQM